MTAADLLAELAERPREAAIILDVDGTLAPIVARPEEASVPAETRELLAGLVERYGLVACLSGRPGEDAARVVGVEGVRYVGEHGLELAPEADEWAERLADFAAGVDWPHEEGKRLSLAFHYRTAEDVAAAERALRAVAERALAEGLRPRWGRRVLEIRPPIDGDKGTAVRQLLAEGGLRRALYAGDDTTDLDAFRGLDGLELAVRIAVVSDEAPDELGARCGPRRRRARRARGRPRPVVTHVDEAMLAPVRERYGEPAVLRWEGEVTDPELALITYSPGRRHDVTLFVTNGDRLALIRKPHFEPGIWRTPGGGVKVGEDFVEGIVREGLEELGAAISLERYLVRAEAVFRFADQSVPWVTHVFSATTDAEVLAPQDTAEIAEARWGTAAELAGPIRERLLATGRALWRYRVALHDAALTELGND